MVQFASYLRRVLCKTRLIFPRINGPIKPDEGFRLLFTQPRPRDPLLSPVQKDTTLLELLRPFAVAKSLTGFKLCATTPNNRQQHATGSANTRNM